MTHERLPALARLALDELHAGQLDFAEGTLDLILANTNRLNNLATQALLSLTHNHPHGCTKFLEQIAQATNHDP